MRSRIEHALRGVVIAVLAVMLWQSLRPQTGSGRVVNATTVDARSLAGWSALPTAASRLQVRLSAVPSAVERAWLAAIAAAGSRVSWRGDLPATMSDAEPIASPARGIRIDIAAPSGSAVILRDELGAIDTLRIQNGGVSVSVPPTIASLAASVNGTTATTTARDSLALRKVLVLGSVGWESKFVAAALEESGWKVDANLRVAPGVDVTQGTPAAIDTSRYSAVVALDAAAAPFAGRIIEFVRRGGGVILAPAAASLDAMSPLRVGNAARANASPSPIPQAGPVDLTSLPLAPLTLLRSDAVIIQKRGSAVAIAGRRVGAGRVLQLGYDDTWRWRMAGGEQSVRDHRRWWTERVSSVAYASATPRTTNVATDEAPLSSLVAAIGPASTTSTATGFQARASDTLIVLFALLTLALTAEVASRRLRGAP
jgi:hypothetical protein